MKEFLNNINKIFTKAKTLVKNGFLHILTGNILNKTISMISSMVIVRLIDKTDYAYISYADNLYSYVSALSGFGLYLALLNFCTAKSDSKKNKAYFYFALKYGMIIDFSMALLICVSLFILPIPFPVARYYAFALLLFQVFNYINNTFSTYLRVLLENKNFAYGNFLYSCAICFFNIVFVLLFGCAGIVFARYLAILISIAFFGNVIHKHLKNVQRDVLTKAEKKSFFSMAISLCIACFFSMIMPANENFLVNNIVKDEIATANFRVAGLFPRVLLLISSAIVTYFFPLVVQTKGWRNIRAYIHKIAVFNFVFVFCAGIIGVVLTPFAIKLVYGEKYVDAISISYLIWGMRAMNACFRTVLSNLMPALGEAKFNAYMSVFSCIIQLLIDYFCIKQFGVFGAAYGAIIVYTIASIVYWVYFESICKRNIQKEERNYEEK